jgi:hypothetical protein
MKSISIFLACVAIAASQASCGGTTTGNPVVTLKAAPYGAMASSWFSLITPAYAAVSELTLCFKRLRFKSDYDGVSNGDTADSENFDFDLGEVTLSPSGSTLGSVAVPAGTYRRIEIELDDHCASGLSVQYNNGSARQTNDRINIKFEGVFEAKGDELSLSLEFDPIIATLDPITDEAQIKAALEDLSCKGTF